MSNAQEYDRFGPWILEIKGEDKLPSLFESYVEKEREARLSFKFPRQIERRKANPSMELYDYVINLYDQDILILERKDKEVESLSLPLKEIEGMSLKENLLKGQFLIYTAKRNYVIPFNTVSMDLMKKMVEMTLQSMPRQKDKILTHIEINPQLELSYFYQQVLAKEQKLNPQLELVAHQPDLKLAHLKETPMGRFFHGLVQKVLLESLYLCDGCQLRIITRDKLYNKRKRPVYAKTTHYLPLANIKGFNWTREVRDPILLRLNLILTHKTLDFCMYGANQGIQVLKDLLED